MRRGVLGYALTAGVAAGVDIGGFHLLAPHLDPVPAAAATSFALAAVVNYLLSSRWVFGSDWRDARRAGLFLAFALLGLTVNSGVTALAAALLPVHATLAKALGVGVAFGANYAMNARWVFRAPAPGACAGGPAGGDRTRRQAARAAPGRPGPSARE